MNSTSTSPINVQGQGLLCHPFDNSGHFTCKAGLEGQAAPAIHRWKDHTGRVGLFCVYHSPFDRNSSSVRQEEAAPTRLEQWAAKVEEAFEEVFQSGPFSDYAANEPSSASRDLGILYQLLRNRIDCPEA